jgi:hypothetical protein
MNVKNKKINLVVFWYFEETKEVFRDEKTIGSKISKEIDFEIRRMYRI